MTKQKEPHIVVIGGGTGSFTLLSGLKAYTKNITALVNMADDGGSTGVLRDEFGVLPPGDVRQCLVALSESPQALRDLFNYRFPAKTSLAGHSFGNLFLSAVEMMSKDFASGVALASEVLKITGQVVPMTLHKTTLHLAGDGGEVVGEHLIGKMPLLQGEYPNLWLVPKAKLNPDAKHAITEADLVVIAPGDLYASLIPALLVDGVASALQDAKAKIVYVCNLVNKPHQTQDFAVQDYVAELDRFIGKDTINTVLYNNDAPKPEQLKTYALEGEYPVKADSTELAKEQYQAIGGAFLSHEHRNRNPNDTLIHRSLIRHDADAVCKKLMELARE